MDGPAAHTTMLARLTVAPALLVMAWLAVSLPQLLAGRYTIGVSLLLFLPAAFVALTVGFTGTVRRPQFDLPGRWHSWIPLLATIVITLGFFAFQLYYNSEQLIVRRDPATYAQTAIWLTDHGSLPISKSLPLLGGPDPALRFDSPGYYDRPEGIVPQFLAGLPLLLAFGGWIGGTAAMLGMAPLLGACAVLSFGGLTARLVGPAWAPVGALSFALCWPLMFVSRSTFSEPAALVLLLGGLCLMHDVRDLKEGRARAFLAGLAFGLVVLVRIDGLRDVLPVVVFAGLLFARRRRTGLPLLGGVLVGAAAGLYEGFTLARPYFEYLAGSLRPLLIVTGCVFAGTVVLVAVVRFRARFFRWAGDRIAASRLPDVAAVLTVLLMIALAVRPYLQTVRRIPVTADDRFNSAYISYLQGVLHLPVDGTRQYTELSLYWVVWYLGIPAVLLATFGAALLLRRLLQRGSPEWVLPFLVIALTTVATLLRPGITPDQPWASRRLVSIVVPGVLLFAVWTLAWATRRIRRLGYGRAVTFVFALLGTFTLAAPVAYGSVGLMFKPVDQGEARAVRGLCRALGPGTSILIVERVTADRFSPVVRSACGLPAARMDGASAADVDRIARRIHDLGRRPVVLGANPADVAGYGAPVRIVDLRTQQDGHSLDGRPKSTWSLTITVWMAQPYQP